MVCEEVGAGSMGSFLGASCWCPGGKGGDSSSLGQSGGCGDAEKRAESGTIRNKNQWTWGWLSFGNEKQRGT